MITKERLEQLIEQGAEIWKIEDGKVYPLRKDHYEYWRIKEDRLEWYWKIVPSGFNYISFEHLFETKEDAEEYAEFGNITKTTQLSYVSWEEFKNRDRNFSFRTYPYDYYCYTDGRYVEIKEYYRSSDRVIFSKKLTRENYNEARRLCVKLFKGE